MKKILFLILSILTMTFFTACGGENTPPTEQKKSEQAASSETKKNDSKILVAYFSRAGDNYEVGVIEKGNTKVVAEMIAEKTDADMFEIKPVKSYPKDYQTCTEVAKEELQNDARPEIVGNVENLEQYDTIFLGYPIWWSDLPMVVYTFLEKNNWQGKTIIPFCTSGGEYMTGKESNIPQHAKGAKMLEGLGLKGKLCQDNPAEVQKKVSDWLAGLGY